MNWTTPADLKAQVQKLWDRGLLLSSMCGGEPIFPRRMTLKGPNSKELSECFPEVRDWIAQLSGDAKHYRIEWRSVGHRIVGTNEIPSEIWVDTIEDALSLIGKRRAAEQFAALIGLTSERRPELVPWLGKRPLRALELDDVWPRLLAVVNWLHDHPRPAVYLRQIDLQGVHTKLIEAHRDVLAELLDIVLPEESIDSTNTGVRGFCRRYGLLDKPLRVRFRVLDPNIAVLPEQFGQDITVTETSFCRLDLPVSNVFISENEISFLAFPNVADAIIVFGAGYGFDHIASSGWLKEKSIHYWGDIDTHGFAILNQLRNFFPHTASFLMDQQTLIAYRQLWCVETHPETANLMRLTAEEGALYNRLRGNHWGDRVRLEQERIGFDYVLDALRNLGLRISERVSQ